MVEEGFDELVVAGADLAGLAQVPLGSLHFVGQGLGRQVLVEGGAVAGTPQVRVDGRQLVVPEAGGIHWTVSFANFCLDNPLRKRYFLQQYAVPHRTADWACLCLNS